jgi:hypothetical protein
VNNRNIPVDTDLTYRGILGLMADTIVAEVLSGRLKRVDIGGRTIHDPIPTYPLKPGTMSAWDDNRSVQIEMAVKTQKPVCKWEFSISGRPGTRLGVFPPGDPQYLSESALKRMNDLAGMAARAVAVPALGLARDNNTIEVTYVADFKDLSNHQRIELEARAGTPLDALIQTRVPAAAGA